MTPSDVELILRDYRRLWKDVVVYKEINPNTKVDFFKVADEMEQCLKHLRPKEREAVYHRLIKGEKWYAVSISMGLPRGKIYSEYLKPATMKLVDIFENSEIIMDFYSSYTKQ